MAPATNDVAGRTDVFKVDKNRTFALTNEIVEVPSLFLPTLPYPTLTTSKRVGISQFLRHLQFYSIIIVSWM